MLLIVYFCMFVNGVNIVFGYNGCVDGLVDMINLFVYIIEYCCIYGVGCIYICSIYKVLNKECIFVFE